MIHAVRKLAREIHRRSVWQVVSLYVALSWALVAALEAVTDVAGLPSWTPTMALVLLVVLLPLIVATAVVQEGIPGLRIEDEVDPNELEGLTPHQVLVIPEAHPLYGVGLLTWRNTVLGAVSSAALLLTSVVAYLVMWSLGIGPVGSLIAQGVIAEQDAVVVAGFVNRTDDPSLGAVVTDAFELDLAESDVVNVVGAQRVREALTRMGQDVAVPLTSSLARQMALQEGIRVVIEGDVARRGRGYLVSVEIVLAGGGPMTFRFDEAASGDDDLLVATDRLAERVREKLGESLRAIRQGEPLELATDSSDALRLYGLAGQADAGGERSEAIDLLLQAVEVDSSFAMAWRKLGVVYEQLADTARAIDAYRRVVDLWTRGGDGGQRTVLLMRERIDALED